MITAGTVWVTPAILAMPVSVSVLVDQSVAQAGLWALAAATGMVAAVLVWSGTHEPVRGSQAVLWAGWTALAATTAIMEAIAGRWPLTILAAVCALGAAVVLARWRADPRSGLLPGMSVSAAVAVAGLVVGQTLDLGAGMVLSVGVAVALGLPPALLVVLGRSHGFATAGYAVTAATGIGVTVAASGDPVVTGWVFLTVLTVLVVTAVVAITRRPTARIAEEAHTDDVTRTV